MSAAGKSLSAGKKAQEPNSMTEFFPMTGKLYLLACVFVCGFFI